MEIDVMIWLLSEYAEAHWKRDVRFRLQISQNTRQEPTVPNDVSEHMQRKCHGYQDQWHIFDLGYPNIKHNSKLAKQGLGPKPEHNVRY